MSDCAQCHRLDAQVRWRQMAVRDAARLLGAYDSKRNRSRLANRQAELAENRAVLRAHQDEHARAA